MSQKGALPLTRHVHAIIFANAEQGSSHEQNGQPDGELSSWKHKTHLRALDILSPTSAKRATLFAAGTLGSFISFWIL